MPKRPTVAVQDTYPFRGGWWIVNGATTLLENWNPKPRARHLDNRYQIMRSGVVLFQG